MNPAFIMQYHNVARSFNEVWNFNVLSLYSKTKQQFLSGFWQIPDLCILRKRPMTKFQNRKIIMKTYINISNVPVEVAEEMKRIAESECDGNESAAYRKIIAEALEARRHRGARANKKGA